MDLAGRLQQLDDLVREAKSMPLSSSALVNREEVLELIQEMREGLPEEIKQARWVVKDREELLAKARTEAESIVAKAREDQLRMAEKESVVERANSEAERILREADDRAREMRLEAEDYADGKLAQFENVLRRIEEDAVTSHHAIARTLENVQTGRERLRGPATVAEQEFGIEPESKAHPLHDEEEGRSS